MKFEMPQELENKINQWIAGHEHCYSGDARYSYIFTPTNLGMMYHVRDNKTREEFNIVDTKF